ncbi:MAG: tRNA (guanosine(37)-N1)-methyltransferase TrmD [Desulfobacteraceae bacterium]|jgi:tRNA (guanine37-N1)-methyltransferase
MEITVLTLFPELFTPFWQHGIIARAISGKQLVPTTLNIRDFALGRHRVVDDRPFGGGPGMVMKPEPLAASIKAAKLASPQAQTILLSPQGQVFDQSIAIDLASLSGIILVCGRYEGIDERICQDYIDAEISMGSFVLTGGEIAAMAIIDAVVRLIPGTLGNPESACNDTFNDNLVEYAHYTRPAMFEGDDVPQVLLTGNHAKIDQWRKEQALIRTLLKRPDLLASRELTNTEKTFLKNWCQEIERITAAKPAHCVGSSSSS